MAKKKYVLSEECRQLGEYIINTDPYFRHLIDCRIAYLLANHSKSSNGKIVYADCSKRSDKDKALVAYDFIITFYADAEGLPVETKLALMEHELMHVGFDPEDKKCWTIPHDLMDFSRIVQKYGVNWIHGIEAQDIDQEGEEDDA